jgi:hypothetical protein
LTSSEEGYYGFNTLVEDEKIEKRSEDQKKGRCEESVM